MDLKQLEKELDALLPFGNYRKITSAKIPTWATRDGLEGLEVTKEGEVKTFWFKDGDRDYNEPTNIVFEGIKERYNNKEQKTELQPAEQAKDENKEHLPVKFVNQLDKVLSGEQIIVPQNIEELKQMTTFDRMLLFQKTRPGFILKRKGRGGEYSYVEGNVMKMEANIAFLFKVSGKIDGWHIDEKGVACYGSLSVDIDGTLVTVPAVGIDLQEFNKETQKPVFSVAELMKNALTDMKKKALADMGFNGDVYRGEV